jgi:hypothetical protein
MPEILRLVNGAAHDAGRDAGDAPVADDLGEQLLKGSGTTWASSFGWSITTACAAEPTPLPHS